MDLKIIVTGDYWHQDFRALLAGFDTVTLVPLEKLIAPELDMDPLPHLVVIAQSRRSQISLAAVEKIQNRFSNTPVVAVLGSWCEGEVRSGEPWPGVARFYWHQWQGRFDSFKQQMETAGITGWHAARTSTLADRILQPATVATNTDIKCVGISSWTRPQFDMLQDAFQQFGWESRWIERCNWDAESTQILNPVCVAADSFSGVLEKRIGWLKSEFPAARFVVILNFPRSEDVQRLIALGISQVVSKPFELTDLAAAMIGKSAGSATRNPG